MSPSKHTPAGLSDYKRDYTELGAAQNPERGKNYYAPGGHVFNAGHAQNLPNKSVYGVQVGTEYKDTLPISGAFTGGNGIKGLGVADVERAERGWHGIGKVSMPPAGACLGAMTQQG